MTKTINLGLILLALLLLHSVHVQTRQAEPPQGAATPQAQPAEDSLGRTTPHGTVVGLITAVEQENLERAAEYLESGLSPAGRRELARKLGAVLDRKLLTSLDSLSDEPDGDAGDGLTDRDLDRRRGKFVRQRGSIPGPRTTGSWRPPVVVLLHYVAGNPPSLRRTRARLDRTVRAGLAPNHSMAVTPTLSMDRLAPFHPFSLWSRNAVHPRAERLTPTGGRLASGTILPFAG